MGGCGSAKAAGGGVGVPQKRDGRFANRPYEVWGVGEATGVWVGVPRPAPLWIPAFAGTTMRGCGAAGGAGGGGVRVPLRRDGRFANRPYEVWGVGEATGVWVGVPRPAPLWIPAFAGTTMGGCGAAGGVGGGGVRVPLRRDGRFANRPYDGEWGTRWGFRWGCAAPRPSEYRLSPVRRWGVRGSGGCWWWGVRWRTETPRAAPLWIPAFAGMTLVGEWGMRWGGGGRRGWGLGA